ncbi:MAG: response regulator [Phycisphaerales bacterium]|nr:response regulator [Phycisphaerales bacterium]
MAKAPMILIADDSRSDRDLCALLLRREGYEIALAQNGLEAIEVARREQPHVIIMDMMMPLMDGLEATRVLRAYSPTANIPIIMVSANNEEEDAVAGLDAGADEYLSKPIRPRDFRFRVRSMVRLRNASLQLQRANAELRRRTDTLAQLNQFCEAVLLDGSVKAIGRKVVEMAAALLQSDRVSLLVPDGNDGPLRVVFALGIDPRIWPKLTIPLDSPISGQVFTGQTEFVANRDTAHVPTIGQYESAFFVSVPLMSTALRSHDGAIGVLNVTEKQDHQEYSNEDVQTCRQIAQTAALALEHAMVRKQLDATRDSIILSMARLSEYRQRTIGRHLERVRDLSALLARYLADDPRIPEKIDEAYITDLRRAAPLHDIGKVAIPDSVLLKKGKLTTEEFQLMREHTSIGEQTLRMVISSGHEVSFLRIAMDIAHYHHERWDGTGYPEGLAGEGIPLCARIVCLADTYDAIRMPREYKPTLSHETATREILAGSGTQFDPRLVQAYCALEEDFRNTYDQLAEDEYGESHESAILAGSSAESWVVADA